MLVAALRAEARPRTGRIEGTITAVNTAAVPPTVTITRGVASVTLNITAATRIQEPGDDHPTLVDLRVGFGAKAEYDPATFNALKIEVKPNDQEVRTGGVVLNSTYESGSNSGLADFDTDADGVRDIVVHTTAATEIWIGKVLIPQSQMGVLIGLKGRVEYDGASFQAFKIEVEPDEGADLEVAGQVTATTIDAAGGGTLTLQTAAGAVMPFQVPPGAEIRMGGRTIALPAVQTGDRVQIKYLVNGTGAGATNLALRIAVQPIKPSHVEGTLTGVVVAGNTLTVQPRDSAAPLTLTVGPGTDLRINGRRSTLTDLATALTNATAAGREVKISAQYLARGGVNLATKIRANVHRRGPR